MVDAKNKLFLLNLNPHLAPQVASCAQIQSTQGRKLTALFRLDVGRCVLLVAGAAVVRVLHDGGQDAALRPRPGSWRWRW